MKNKVIYLQKIRRLAQKYQGIYKEEIEQILKNDTCFLEMSYQTTYKLLKVLGLNEREIEFSIIELLRD